MQNGFTRWTAIGTAASAAIGMTAMDILVVTVLMGTFVFCQKTLYGSVCPPVLDGIATAAVCLIGISHRGLLRIRSRPHSRLARACGHLSKEGETGMKVKISELDEISCGGGAVGAITAVVERIRGVRRTAGPDLHNPGCGGGQRGIGMVRGNARTPKCPHALASIGNS